MEIGAAVTAIKAAIDAAKAAKDVHSQEQLDAAISEIMEKLTTAQSDLLSVLVQQQELVEDNRRLKEKLEKEARFERYRLEQTPMGGYIMPLKDEYVTPDQVAHSICPHCRESGRLSVLSSDEHFYRCVSCKYTAQHTNIDISGHGEALC